MVQILSPRGILHSAIALADRPARHRRRPELMRESRPPRPDWWTGDERWFSEDTPPRQGNLLTPLIDGQEAMRAMYEAMESARESIYAVIWYLTPQFRLLRPPDALHEPSQGGGGPNAFIKLMADKADDVDVRILLWPGAMLGKFSYRNVGAVHRALVRANPRIKARLDHHERTRHCHHQKALVVDGKLAFVGGLDPTAFDADRWDEQRHPFRDGRNWHDAHWKIEGPCVTDVMSNFVQRWNENAPHDALPHPVMPAPLPDGVDAQVQRTIPTGIYSFAPRGIFGIAHGYLSAIKRAERFIYLENQYLWSPEIADALCDAIERGAQSRLQIALVLPAHPNIGKADTDRHIDRLRQADAGRGLIRVYTLYTSCPDDARRGYRYRPIYVHAKVGIIDDSWATVGSANLNGRGMATDSELNVTTTGAVVIQKLRLRLWSEHLSLPEEELAGQDAVMLLAERWPEIAAQQERIVKSKSGLLTAAAYPYPLGHVDADFGPGEIESAILDR